MQVKIKHNSYSNADAFIGGMLIGAGLGVLAASINNHNSSLDDIRSL